MARRKEDYDGYDEVIREGRPQATTSWGDTRVIVAIVVAVGLLAIVGAVVFRVNRSKESRRKKIANHKALGSSLVRKVHAIGVDYFSQGKKSLDPSRFDEVRAEPALVEAMLIELDDFDEQLVAAAKYETPTLEKFRGVEELKGGVKLTRGRIISAGSRIPVWMFELHIYNDKRMRLGKAMVCLKAIKED